MTEKCLLNLLTFRSNTKLKQATWTFLVTYMATEDDKQKLVKIF